MTDAMLSIEGLSVEFLARKPWIGTRKRFRAVDDVTLKVAAGECLGLAGESGCGKTTLGRAIVGTVPAATGSIWFEGRDLVRLAWNAFRPLRRRLQMVLQEASTALDPRYSVAEIVAEALDVHELAGGAGRQRRVGELLHAVGLDQGLAGRRPHELSGGQRQRVGIARALAVEPSLLIADEPFAGLDSGAQSQLIALLNTLRRAHRLTVLVASHDLRVLRLIADRLAVMYRGRLVEVGPTAEVLGNPAHPYAEGLVRAARTLESREPLPPRGTNQVANPLSAATGCVFRPTCPRAVPICSERAPALVEVGRGHAAACLLAPDGRKPAAGPAQGG